MGFTGAVAASVAGSAISGAMSDGGGGGGGGAAGGYQPMWQPGADQQWIDLMKNAASVPGYYGTLRNMVDTNPYTDLMQGTAETAGEKMGGLSGRLDQSALDLRNFASGMQPAAQQLLQMGFDPRSELYNRTQQQLLDQTRASLAARGINPSGIGAGIENKAMSDFNIDWQNQQLARGLSALGGYGTSMGQFGQAQTTAGQLDLGAAQAMQAAGQIPYDVYRGRAQDLANFNDYFSRGVGQFSGIYGNYLNVGQGANAQAMNAYQYGQNREDEAMGGITGAAGPWIGKGLDYLWNDHDSGGGGDPGG